MEKVISKNAKIKMQKSKNYFLEKSMQKPCKQNNDNN